MLDSKKDFFEKIGQLGKYQIIPGLTRIKKVLAELGNPQNKFRFIHIAGTNGKGSTALFCAAFLKEFYNKVGLFISPEIRRYNDRITINDKEITDKSLIFHSNRILKIIEEDEGLFLTEFEFCAAIMFDYFCAQNIDYAVIETGMGGRLDATNAGKPEVSIVTSIDLDHTEFLGNTLAEICFEKTAVFKRAKFSIAGKMSAQKYKIMENCISENFPFSKNIDYYGRNYKIISAGQKIFFKNERGTIDVSALKNMPVYQKYNCATALQALTKICGRKIFNHNINQLIQTLMLPFRFQKICAHPFIIIDSSHNVEAVRYFINAASNETGLKICVYSGFKDKNYKKIIELLSNSFDRLFVFNLNHPRAADLKDYHNRKNIVFFDNPLEIKKKIMETNKENNYKYFITGSYVTARLFLS